MEFDADGRLTASSWYLVVVTDTLIHMDSCQCETAG